MPDTAIACIDVGTTGARTLIYSLQGELLSQAYKEYTSIFLSPTWIDHDPSTWINGVKNTFVRAVKQFSGDADSIAAISVISQRSTVTPVDEQGVPLANAMLWQDKRAISQTEYIRDQLGDEEVYRRTGLRIDPYFSLPKILWLKENNTHVFSQTHKFLTVHDLVINYLTGAFVTDWTQASRTMLFNIERLAWDQGLCEHFGIPLHILPEAVPPGTVVGEVSAPVGKELGLRHPIPVVAAGGDQQAAAVGLGIVAPELMCVNTGTGSFILAHTDKPAFDPERRVVCTASAVAGKWLMEAGIFTSGSVYRWFRDTFAMVEKTAADALSIDAYEIINSEVKNSPPGADGILLVPHFAGTAAPYWNPEASGVIFGLSLGHTRPAVIRALLEGITLEINKNIRIIEELVGSIREIRVSGGAARSTTFNQIQADVYGKQVLRSVSEQSSGLGALILAATAIGKFPSLEQAVDALLEFDPGGWVQPREKYHTVYERVGELHDAIYQALNNAGVYEKAAGLMRLLRKE